MFELTKDFLENLKKAINFEPQLAPIGANIQYMGCGGCTGTCKNSCKGSCRGSCDGGCTRSCKGRSR